MLHVDAGENSFGFIAVGVRPASKLCAMQQGQRRGIRLSAREVSLLLAVGLPALVTFGCTICVAFSFGSREIVVALLDQDSPLRFCGRNL